jgi:ankyrin repeat protein
LARAHPEYLASPRAMFEAAKRDRPDVLQLLLDLGASVDVADQTNARPLHQAAVNNALRAAQFLIDHGAEIDPRETSWGGAPIGWASHGDHQEMLALLAPHSRNVSTLTFRGFGDRLREVLREEPDLARQVSPGGITPLWWLPDDEPTAMAILAMLLAAGADASIKSRDGHTAADRARQRGMIAVAQALEQSSGAKS